MKPLDEEVFRSLIQQGRDLIVLTNNRGTVVYVSPAVQVLLGYSVDEYVGTNVWDRVHPDDVDVVADVLTLAVPRYGFTVRPVEFRHRHADGSWRWLEATANNLLDDLVVGGVAYNARDITERKGYEEQLRHRAFHDPLTDLANWALLMDRAEHALKRAFRHGHVVGVLYLDIDRLKRVNDSLGHEAGDKLITAISARLLTAVRAEDTVARLLGDEFAVLLEDIGNQSEAAAIATRILDELAAPVPVAGREVVATASIGIAMCDSRDATPTTLLQAADAAMYRAKVGGGARYEVYGPGIASVALERLELEAQLRRALERDEFVVYYQPKVELSTGRIAHVEALVRWRHPTRGMLPPCEFIGLAEETGLIVPIGRWVLEQACRQVREWQDRYACDPPLVVNVNLSVREFGHPEVIGEVSRILHETRLDAGGLELEITESVVMADSEAAAATLRRLEGLGVRLAIDDFGTGYSSLSHLRRFPISTLKIDREFVHGLHQDPEDTAILAAVLGLGDALGLKVVAEGIETAEDLAALQALGCEFAQGYYLCRPQPAQEIDALLSEGRPLTGGE